MGRLRLVAGAFGIVVGFFVYQYGFFLTLNLSQSLSNWTITLFPSIGSLEIMGAALQLIGGMIAIAGLLICISWVGSRSAAKFVPDTLEATSKSRRQALESAPRCKFCGAVIESGTAFCPSCQRAQA